METSPLTERVAQETDDVLCTIQLVKANEQLTDRLFDQLVDLLVETVFLDLRADLTAGRLTPEAYHDQLADFAARCHQVGLLPLGR